MRKFYKFYEEKNKNYILIGIYSILYFERSSKHDVIMLHIKNKEQTMLIKNDNFFKIFLLETGNQDF